MFFIHVPVLFCEKTDLTRRIILPFLVLFIILAGSVPAQTQPVVIVHPENPLTEIEKGDLVKIFRLSKTVWADGTIIKSVNLKAGNPVRESFFTEILDENSKKIEDLYRKKSDFAAAKRKTPALLGRSGRQRGYSTLTGARKKSGGYSRRRYEKKSVYIPKTFVTEKEVLEFVSRNSGSIGYVLHPDKSVKVIAVTGVPVKIAEVASRESSQKPLKTSTDSSPADKKPAAEPLPVSVPKPAVGAAASAVPKVIQRKVPEVIAKPVPKPIPKPAPEVPVVIVPASISSASVQTFNINESGSRQAADITVKGPVRASKEIRIHIPENLDMEWDKSVAFLKISGSARKSLRRWVTYSDDRKTLRLPVTGDFQSGEQVVLSGMKFTGFRKASSKAGFLWLEVDSKGTRESVDDKSVRIQEGPSYLVISAPLNKIPSVGERVEALRPKTEVAGNPFQVELYLVDDHNIRLAKGRSVFLEDSWVSPAKPVSKKHISVLPRKITLEKGYARVSVTYPEAGTINLIAGESEKGPPYASFKVGLRPAYLTLTAAACGISGNPLPVIVRAVNARGVVTKNYEGSILLRSRLAYGTSGVSVTRPEDRSIPVSGGKTEIQYVYSDAGTLLFSATGAYLRNEFIETKNQKVVCFRPSAFRVTPAVPAKDRSFFYSSPSPCSSPDYVDVRVEAVNSAGKITRNFLGDMLLESEGGEGLSLPGSRLFTDEERGVKTIKNTIYSKKEQSVAVKATGNMKEGLCQCDSFSGVSAKIIFRQGNILVTPKTGIAGGLTRKRTGKIVQVLRATSSGQLSVPVTLQFNNGEVITEDNSTQVSLRIESETGMVRNSASIEGNNSFKASKGKGVFLLTDSEGESVSVTTSSNPCLASGKGDITFSDDKVVILTSSGHFHEYVDLRIAVHDKSGNITKKYDGTVIEGLTFEPRRDYMVVPSEKIVIKDGTASVKVKNNNPETGKMELFIVKPLLKDAALIVKPEKVRFRGLSKKSGSSFSDMIGRKIKDILGK